jgi:SAM-dependent methyltransferase
MSKLFRQRNYNKNVGDIISNDKYLNFIYNYVYKIIIENLECEGKTLELGATSYSIKNFSKETIITNIDYQKNLDLVTSGISLPIKNDSITNLILKDTFHHLDDIVQSFKEFDRILKIGGSIILVEPYWSIPLRLIAFFFHPEPFNFKATEWGHDFKDINMGNQALAHNVFIRDIKEFESKFKDLQLNNLKVIVGISYILSGGLYKRTIFPSWLLIKIHKLEIKFKLFLTDDITSSLISRVLS